VLCNQSYHMVDLAVNGPDAFAMLEHLGINSFRNFKPDRAKQFVPVTPDGYVIGDVILFYLDENHFNLVGRAPTIEWVEDHAATGNWNVTAERDERWAMRTDGKRNSYRFQVQGPNAMKIIEKAIGATPPDLKFFHMCRLHDRRQGRARAAPRHGRAAGLRTDGTLWKTTARSMRALVEAGKEFGMALVGGRRPIRPTRWNRAGSSSPFPAIYTGEKLEPYREWLTRPTRTRRNARSAAAGCRRRSRAITRRLADPG